MIAPNVRFSNGNCYVAARIQAFHDSVKLQHTRWAAIGCCRDAMIAIAIFDVIPVTWLWHSLHERDHGVPYT
jgi:hypothetical protein